MDCGARIRRGDDEVHIPDLPYEPKFTSLCVCTLAEGKPSVRMFEFPDGE
jgi:hypothetical protein